MSSKPGCDVSFSSQGVAAAYVAVSAQMQWQSVYLTLLGCVQQLCVKTTSWHSLQLLSSNGKSTSWHQLQTYILVPAF